MNNGVVDRLVYIKGVYSIGDGNLADALKRASLAEINVKFRGSTDCKVRGQQGIACIRLIYLFELKTFTTSSIHVPLIRLNDFAANFSAFLFRVFSFRAVLYLPDHKAYTSTVYRPHGCISSLGIIIKKLAAGFANVCTGQRMICNGKMGSLY